jgi:hypothetical protein
MDQTFPLPSPPPAVGVDRETINISFLLGNFTPPFSFSSFFIIISLSVPPSYNLPYHFMFLIHPLKESPQS